MLAESSQRSYKVRITHSGDTGSTEKTLNYFKTVELRRLSEAMQRGGTVLGVGSSFQILDKEQSRQLAFWLVTNVRRAQTKCANEQTTRL